MDEKFIKFDKRIIERNIDKAIVGQADYDVYLSSLQDMASEAEVLKFESDQEDEENDESSSPDSPETMNISEEYRRF